MSRGLNYSKFEVDIHLLFLQVRFWHDSLRQHASSWSPAVRTVLRQTTARKSYTVQYILFTRQRGVTYYNCRCSSKVTNRVRWRQPDSSLCSLPTESLPEPRLASQDHAELAAAAAAPVCGLVLCDTWNWRGDNDTGSGIAILDTTATPEMRSAISMSLRIRRSQYSQTTSHYKKCELMLMRRATA